MPPRTESVTGARTRGRRVAWLWRWHGRAGVLACVLLLLLAMTGLALNHAEDLRLDERKVDWDWPYALYGSAVAGTWKGYAAGESWVLQGGEGRLYLGTRAIGSCDGTLVGAVGIDGMLLVACERELLLLTPEGDRIDALNAAAGLPLPVTGCALQDGVAHVLAGGRWQAFDPDDMGFSPSPMGDARPLPATVPPEALIERLGRASEWLHWERFLLDLHSGRLFGRAGVIVVDAGGVLSLLLALSGIVMWGARRR